jgi:hypothetical protein
MNAAGAWARWDGGRKKTDPLGSYAGGTMAEKEPVVAQTVQPTDKKKGMST